MPLDSTTGVFYALHGVPSGQPLLVTLPLMASFAEIFGAELAPVLNGYLERLTDRYRVLLVDYPSIGASRDIAPHELTADRCCSDLLGVASAAGFDRFAYWGYSWGGNVGLQLATRTPRLTALVVGGWPALGAPYEALLAAARRKLPNPEPSSMKVLRHKAQYAQWVHYGESLAGWAERDAVARIVCPRLNLFGSDGDLVEAGIEVPIASCTRVRRAELEALGWRVHEIAGHGHGLCMQPEVAVPPVRAFLDQVLP
ncbi:MAG: alpha/beta fold hydrolase [Rubrivivax sp.]|nr:alpha/beta fold hydrolase [Rubrivivax sp.]